ncbi:MAG: FAD-binding oxidoreductase, partial [Propionibacterium sp.]|nr:FAD-binding oxidoreductase [Propionibacterium sp.]
AIPELPPQLSGKSYAVVEAVTTLDPADADALLAPLRALGPSDDTFTITPVERLDQLNMDPPAPTPIYGDGWLQTELSVEAVEAIVQAAGPGVDTPLLTVDLRHLGAAVAPGRGGGAVDGLPGAFLGFAVGVTPEPASVPPARAAVARLMDSLAPWREERSYLNFAEQPSDGSSFFDPATWARLRAIKAAVDPDDLIRSNHPVPSG